MLEGFIVNNKGTPQEAKSFYDNLELYHKNVDKILELIRDYFDDTKLKYSKEYMALKIKKDLITDSTHELDQDSIERISFWSRTRNKDDEDVIFTIELHKKIFFCKAFDFQDNELILAGYLLKDSASVRTFLSKFSEEKLREKYEKLLSII